MGKYTILLFIFCMSSHLLYGLDMGTYDSYNCSQGLFFTENKGQVITEDKISDVILFTAKSNGVAVFISNSGISYQFHKSNNNEFENNTVATHRVDMKLIGSNNAATVRKEHKLDYYENYYLSQTDSGILNICTYRKIVIENIYPHIDWVLYGDGQSLKYDFIIHPMGNICDIKISYKYNDGLNIQNDGSLKITTSLGCLVEAKPYCYQSYLAEVKSSFIKTDELISFWVDDYDKGKDLIIDPSIIWSTYYGGQEVDIAQATCVDRYGNVFLSGFTSSYTKIAHGGHNNAYSGSGYDGFLVKFNSLGRRQWATYYGRGPASDCVADNDGNIYLCGSTNSSANIAVGGFKNTFTAVDSTYDYDAYLVKFDPHGKRIWGTYYGDNLDDRGSVCAVDKLGYVYLSGTTENTTGIHHNGHQNMLNGSYDGFLVKFDSSCNRIWATYYGGTSDDRVDYCTTDDSLNVYITGITNSGTGIAYNGHQNTLASFQDAYIVKFDSSGQRKWGSYYGGGNHDYGDCCAIDHNGNVYLCGMTQSPDSIAYGGLQDTFGGNGNYEGDAYLVKFNNSGTRLWATYFGGSDDDWGTTCFTDKSNNIYMAGNTVNSNFASGGFQNTFGGGANPGDGFILKLDTAGSKLWATYYGGTLQDQIIDIAIDTFDNIYAAGKTVSSNNIAYRGHQNTREYLYDAFLAKISNSNCSSIDTPTIDISIMPDTIFCDGSVVKFTANTVNATTGIAYEWLVNDTSVGVYNSSYTTDKLTTTDKVTCILFCSDSCLATNVIASNDIVVKVLALPTPTIVKSGDTLFVDSGYNYYQWFLNDTLIPAAVSSKHVATKNGDYYVVVDSNSCIDTSLIITINNVGINSSLQPSEIKIYPNPNKGQFTLLHLSSKGHIIVNNLMGQAVYNSEYVSDNISNPLHININEQPPGIYILIIEDEDSGVITIEKIVIN